MGTLFESPGDKRMEGRGGGREREMKLMVADYKKSEGGRQLRKEGLGGGGGGDGGGRAKVKQRR